MKNYKSSNRGVKALALILATVLVVGATYTGLSVGLGSWNPSDWTNKVEQPEETPEEDQPGGAIIEENESNSGVKLASRLLAKTEYAQYDVSPLAEDAFSLTATITPAEATYKDVEWTIAFENPSSSWAQGKTVTDYASLPDTTALTNSLSINKAFGEPIIIKVTSLDNPEAYATCKVNYIKRITSFSLTWSNGSTSSTNLADGEDDMEVRSNIQYSDGTVSPTITYSAKWEKEDLVATYPDVSTQLANIHYSCTHGEDYSLDFSAQTLIREFNNEEATAVVSGGDTFAQINFVDIIRTECSCSYTKLPESVKNQVKSTLYYAFNDAPILIGSFTLTYTAKYGDKTVSSGTKTLTQYLDFSKLSVPVSNIQMNQTTIFA